MSVSNLYSISSFNYLHTQYTTPERLAYAQRVGQDGWWLLKRMERDKQAALLWQSPTKNPNTQANHFFASILAYTKLEVLKLKVGLGHFRSKAQLYLAGLKAMQQELTRIAA